MNPAPASYAIIAAQAAGGGDMGKLVHGLGRACWAEEQDLSRDEVIRGCLTGAGFDPSLADKGLLAGPKPMPPIWKRPWRAASSAHPSTSSTAASASGVRTGWMIWTRIWRAISDMTQDVRGGVPTHWITLGQGPRQALLIHCSLGHAGGWSRMVAALDDLVTAIAYDLPGHGRSADWDGTTNIQDVSTAMAVDLLEDQAKGKPVDVIGHSFGGTVALRLAVERPDLVRSAWC